MKSRMGDALEARARRAAKRVGLRAVKSRDRTTHWNNRSGFMLVDPLRNQAIEGLNYTLSPEDVLRWCERARPARPYGPGSDVMCFDGWR